MDPLKNDNLNRLKVHNFTIPRNDPSFICLRMEASLYFETNYISVVKVNNLNVLIN